MNGSSKLRGERSQTTKLKNEPKAIRAFEDAMLNYVALDQTLREMKAHMAVSIMLQILGFSQDEIGGWFDYTQQGISYHANVAKREMERG